MVNVITLSHGKIALVDDIDLKLLGKYKWSCDSKGYVRREGKMDNYKRQRVYLHREILNANDDEIIDHINHDTLDNRRCNLRIVSKALNSANSLVRANSTSGFKGVTWFKKSLKWRSRIRSAGKEVFLGLFNDKTEAARAYNDAAIKYFGEFAYLNNVKEMKW